MNGFYSVATAVCNYYQVWRTVCEVGSTNFAFGPAFMSGTRPRQNCTAGDSRYWRLVEGYCVLLAASSTRVKPGTKTARLLSGTPRTETLVGFAHLRVRKKLQPTNDRPQAM